MEPLTRRQIRHLNRVLPERFLSFAILNTGEGAYIQLSIWGSRLSCSRPNDAQMQKLAFIYEICQKLEQRNITPGAWLTRLFNQKNVSLDVLIMYGELDEARATVEAALAT